MNTCAQTGRPRDFDAERIAYNKRTKELRKAAHHLREDSIMQTMCRYELESDEFYTASEKAIIYQASGW